MLLFIALLACDPAAPTAAPTDAPTDAFAPTADAAELAYTRQQLEAQVVALSRQVSALQAAMRTIESRTQLLEGSDRELWAGLEQVQVGGIQALTTRADATDTTVADLAARFQSLEGAGLVSRVGAIESTIRPLTVYDDADRATLSTLTATIADLHRVNDDQDLALGALIRENDDQDVAISDLRRITDDMDSSIGALIRENDDQDIVISDLRRITDDMDSSIGGLRAATEQHGVVVVTDDSDTLSSRISAQEQATCVQDDALRATLSAELIPCGDAICVRTATGDQIWRQWANSQLLALDAGTCAP